MPYYEYADVIAMLAKLLAAPELINTKLGEIMHQSGKKLLRKFIDMAHSHYEPVLTYKKENGWIKPHVKVEEDAFKFVKFLYEHPINNDVCGGGWGPGGLYENNGKMFQKVMDLFLTIQDEDTAYDLPWLLWLRYIHEHWDEFELATSQAYHFMNFPNAYKNFLEWAAPMPQDDGSDIEEDNIDYIAAEKKIVGEKDGMGN